MSLRRQGHSVKSPMFMHSHFQHRLGSLNFTAKVLLWTSRVQIKLNHKTKQNNSVMTALQKILYQRFYVFPKSTRCFWEENVYVFICPLWRPDLNWAFRTTRKVNSFWCWLHEDDWCCRECRQTIITIINSDSPPSLPSTSPSLSRKPAVCICSQPNDHGAAPYVQLYASFPVLLGERIRPFTGLRAFH